MPIGYTVDHEQGVVFVRAWGVLTDASVSAQAQAMQNDPEIAAGLSVLVDLRDVTVNQLTIKFLQRFPTSFERSAHRAIVVGDVYGFAIAQAYSGWVADEGAAIVTRDLEAALDWLRLPPRMQLPGGLDAAFGLAGE